MFGCLILKLPTIEVMKCQAKNGKEFTIQWKMQALIPILSVQIPNMHLSL